MTAMHFRGFRGSVPRTAERLQLNNFARSARNIKITNGNIVPLKGMLLSSTTLTAAIKSFYRYRRVSNGQRFDNWLTFEHDTDVCRSPLADDPDGRVYWTSEAHEPRMSTYGLAIDGPGPYPDGWFMLGVPSPTVAPTVATAPISGTVTAASANTPTSGKVTITLNTVEGLVAGDSIVIAGVVGMTDINQTHVIESVSGSTVVVPRVTSQTYTSGGTWTRSTPAVTRAYAYTFVTALGEESGPSPASALVNGLTSKTWAITAMQTAPANSGTASAWTDLPSGRVEATLNSTFGMQDGTTLVMTYDTAELDDPIVETVRLVAVDHTASKVQFVRTPYPAGTTPTLTWQRAAAINTSGMRKRIYRTEGTAAAFLFVTEIPVADTSYNDSTVILTGEVMPTAATLPPPARLHGLIALPNGCFAGFVDNELCLSDPYMPYSWPIKNRLSFTSRCVALGPVGNSIVVLTDGYPIMVTGSDPEAMSPVAMESYAPCLGKRGAVNVGGGMMYASNDGLWLASVGAARLMTGPLFRIDEWRPLNPQSFDAVFHDGKYVAVHTPVGATKRQMIVMDIAELDSVITVDDFADALLRNDYDGNLYTAKGARILRWDADDLRRYISEWTSVEVQLEQPTNFSVAQVHADFKQVVPPDLSVLENNQALIAQGPDAVGGFILSGGFLDFEFNGSNLTPYNPPTPRTVQFVLYEGDEPKFAKRLQNERPFRLPKGFKQETLRIGINASVPCFNVSIAESTEELKQASK